MACNGLLSLTALQLCLLALLLHIVSNYTSGLSPSPSHSKSPFPSALSSDRDALQEVAASLSRASPPAHRFFGLHWKPERDCCVWRGVTCGISSSRVVGLNLTGLRGWSDAGVASLPRAICELSALTSLDLSNNGLVGAIPTCFGHNLTSLQTLILAENLFTFNMPPLANLSLLTHLDLSENRLDESNSSISTLSFPYLTYLDLSDGGPSLSAASLPLRLHNPRLQYLNLYCILVPCSNLSFISGLSDLQQLTVDFNPLSYIGASSAAYLSTTPLPISSDKLQVLELEGVSVSASSLGSLLCGLRSLKQLALISTSGPSDAVNYSVDIKRLPCERPASVGLTYLDLSGQGFTGPFPAWVGDFTRLQYLDLRGNKFQGSIPQEWLQALTHLTSLQLSGESPSTPVPLSKKAQNWLFRLPLETLTLSSMGLLFHNNMPCAEAGFSLLNQTLMWLDLSDNHFSASLWHCLRHHNFSRLQSLDLSNNPLAVQLQPPVPNFVQELDLSFCQLSGSLFMDLFSKAAPLFVVNISHNSLVGSIPPQIGLLGSAVWKLDLSYNNLTGPIPPSIWNLSGIAALLLHNNHLYGEILVSQLSLSVGVLSVANNYLSKASFHNVISIELLDLSSNHLEGSFEDLLGDYSLLIRGQVVVLFLFGNQLNGFIPASFGTLASSLIIMDLSHNNLTGAIPHSLKHLQALQSNIGVIPIAEAAFDYIFTLEDVKNLISSVQFYFRGHLDLSFNELNGSIPKCLGALLGLNDLILSNNQLSGPIPPDLALLVSLETLDLSYNKLQGAIPAALSSLTSLGVFNVSFNPELSGPIPDGPQLETIASYEGDDRLCGQVVQRDCGEGQILAAPEESQVAKTGEKESIKEKISSGLRRFEEWVAIPGVCVGYVVGVGLTIWGLKFLRFYK